MGLLQVLVLLLTGEAKLRLLTLLLLVQWVFSSGCDCVLQCGMSVNTCGSVS